MTLPQLYPQSFLDWASAVNNIASAVTSQSGILLGYVYQTDMSDVSLEYGVNLAPISDLELEVIVPNSGLMQITLQAMVARATGSGGVHMGVTLGHSGPALRTARQFISTTSPRMYEFNILIELEPGSTANLVGGARTDSNTTGLLYRSSGVGCLFMVRAL